MPNCQRDASAVASAVWPYPDADVAPANGDADARFAPWRREKSLRSLRTAIRGFTSCWLNKVINWRLRAKVRYR